MCEEAGLELYSYEYFLQEDVCRLCWTKNAYISLKCEDDEKKDVHLMLAKDFLLDLDIEEPPNKICELCWNQVENFHNFKLACQESERKLRVIREQRIKTETCEIINIDPDIKLYIDSYENITFKTSTSTDTNDSFENSEINNVRNSINDSDSIDNTVNDINSFKTSIRKKPFKKRPRPETYCNICFINLTSENELSVHRKETHGIENGLHKCFGCEKVFRNRKLVLSHELLFCKNLRKGYKCSKCDKYLPNRRTFEIHDKIHRGIMPKRKKVTKSNEHDNIFKCFICRGFFKDRDELNNHISSEHRGTEEYVCEVCGRKFSRRDYLRKHSFIHTNVKPFHCQFCDYRTNQKSSLNSHIRKHTGERPHRCDVCDYATTSAGNLNAHKQKHTKEKPYECSACQKSFSYKRSLEEHVTSAHASEAFVCGCGAAYTRARALKRHQAAKSCTNVTCE